MSFGSSPRARRANLTSDHLDCTPRPRPFAKLANRHAATDQRRPRSTSSAAASRAWAGSTNAASGEGFVDAGDLVVMPGLVDTHVHVNEPGRTDWEGFETATRAAAAGGVTTLLDMPLNSIPATTSVAALHEKARAARGKVWVDVGFIGGVLPDNASALGDLARAGVRAFKCFLVPSGVPEFQHVTQPDLRDAMPVLAELGLPLMVHAELPEVVEAATLEATAGDPVEYATYLASRPPAAEHEAVALVIELAEITGARVHIVHVSSAQTAHMVSSARARGVRISAETCPHYLWFAADEVPNGATEYKCAPPIRRADDRGGSVVCALVRRASHDRVRSFAVPADPQAPRRRRLLRCVGRDRVAPARERRGVDGTARARVALERLVE